MECSGELSRGLRVCHEDFCALSAVHVAVLWDGVSTGCWLCAPSSSWLRGCVHEEYIWTRCRSDQGAGRVVEGSGGVEFQKCVNFGDACVCQAYGLPHTLGLGLALSGRRAWPGL